MSEKAVTEQVLLILGANGRVAQLLRNAWHTAPLTGWRPVWCARKAATGIDVVWSPGEQAPCRADAILALWGVVPGQGDLAENTSLAHAAMTMARQSGATRVLHCSSAAVYGPGAALNEDTPCAPTTPYGTAKLAMEAAISKELQPESCAMRLANVVGADSLFRALESGTPVVIDRFSDGAGPRRSYATPSCILQTVAALLETGDLPPVINVAHPGTVSMEALTQAAEQPFTWQAAPEGALSKVVMETQLLQRLAGGIRPADPTEIIAEWKALT